MVIISIGSTRDHLVDALAVNVERGLLGLRVSAPQNPHTDYTATCPGGTATPPTPSLGLFTPQPTVSIYVLHPYTPSLFCVYFFFSYSIDQPTSFG